MRSERLCVAVHRRKAYPTQERHISAARTKQYELERDTGIRTAGGENKQRERPGRARRKREGRNIKNRTSGGDSIVGARLF